MANGDSQRESYRATDEQKKEVCLKFANGETAEIIVNGLSFQIEMPTVYRWVYQLKRLPPEGLVDFYDGDVPSLIVALWKKYHRRSHQDVTNLNHLLSKKALLPMKTAVGESWSRPETWHPGQTHRLPNHWMVLDTISVITPNGQIQGKSLCLVGA